MSPAALAFWRRAQGRVAGLQPQMTSALLSVFAALRDMLNEADLAKLITNGTVEQVIALALSAPILARAFIPLRVRLRATIEKGFGYAVRDLPKAGKIDGILAVSFDHLSPKVVEAIQTLETRVLTSLTDDIRATVRGAIERGLVERRGAASVAREIRSVIGLGPTQAAFVQNLRTELETGKYADAARRKLIDRRFNLSKLDGLSATARAERIDVIVDAYRKSMIAMNANTVARTATLDSYKLGQKLSWEDAEAKGVIPEGFQVMREWIGMADDRERPEHWIMNGEVVPADEPYSNGQDFAGEGDYNCRCLDRYRLTKAA